MNTWSPFTETPLQQWSNEIHRPNSISLAATSRQSGKPAAVTPSPHAAAGAPSPQAKFVVSCRIGAHHFSIPAQIPQADASQAAPDNWREQFKRVLRCLSAPAIFNLSGSLNRWSFQSRIQILQEAVRSFSKSFQMFLRWVAHDEQLTTEPKACRTQTKGIRNP